MAAISDRLTQVQRDYLATQTLGRLATVDGSGAPQNNPVGFRVNDDGTIDIGGRGMASSRKFRNIARDARVAFVVDDVSTEPPGFHFVEIRGTAEQLFDQEPYYPGQDPVLIRIHPLQVYSYGLGEEPTR